jgi:regulator of protease activity HflC (stomatin/prohibitin superfamily)
LELGKPYKMSITRHKITCRLINDILINKLELKHLKFNFLFSYKMQARTRKERKKRKKMLRASTIKTP